MKNNRVWYAVSVVMMAASISACTSLNTKVGGMFNADTDLALTFKTDADINPDDKKRPSPLFIRMYELRSTKMFEKANFLDIFEREAETMGGDLVAKQTLKRLRPGEGREDKFVLKPETRYVGLVAEFLQYRDARYKVLIPVAPTNVFSSTADIYISGNSLSTEDDLLKKPASGHSDSSSK